MTKAGRKATAALVGTLVMMAGGRVNAAGEQPGAGAQYRPTIVLHVVNSAALPGDVLTEAMRRVERVYDFIGVRIVWFEGKPAGAKRQDDGLHLTVLLLSREMAEKKISAEGLKEGVLGQAHLPSGRASIFCDRIAGMLTAPKVFVIPLGAVIAHEVGHLLLRVNSHSRSGIMRASVDLHAVQLQNFDQTQARTIHTMLTEPTALVAGR